MPAPVGPVGVDDYRENVFDSDMSTEEKLAATKEHLLCTKEWIAEESAYIQRALEWIDTLIPRQPKKAQVSPQKDKKIREMLRENPRRSNTWIAEDAKASATTIMKIRSEMEQAGEIEAVEYIYARDGRRQPIHK